MLPIIPVVLIGLGVFGALSERSRREQRAAESERRHKELLESLRARDEEARPKAAPKAAKPDPPPEKEKEE